MKQRGQGSDSERLETAPRRRGSNSTNSHTRLQKQATGKQSQSEWHTSIQKKDWTQLQKYLEELTKRPKPHASSGMADRSSASNHSSGGRNKHSPSSRKVLSKETPPKESKRGPSKRGLAIGKWLKKKTAGSMRQVTSGMNKSSRVESQSEMDRNSTLSQSFFENVDDDIPSSPAAAHGPALDKASLLATNAKGRTPLQVALNTPEIPDTMLHKLVRAQPRAVSKVDAKGRLPLHFAIVKERRMGTIQALTELYVDALYHKDSNGKTPVAYAIEVAKQHTHLSEAPKHFWALARSPYHPEAEWQTAQSQHWEMARWCLQTAAAFTPHQKEHGHFGYEPENQHAQPSAEAFLLQTNSDNSTQPYVIQAMLHAAPPTVVTLLIDASKSLFLLKTSESDSESDIEDNDENQQAVSLGCSAFYLAIFRQYPLSILKQMGGLLYNSYTVKTIRDETGLGLVSAHYVTKCFEKSKLMEYSAAEEFMVTVEQCIVEGELPADNPQFIEWWDKLKYLIFFCANNNPENTPDEYLLHSALENTDTPPNVIRLLLALYPGSARQPDTYSAHPLHLFALHRDYIPRNYESPYMHGLNVMDMLLSLDESAAYHKYKNRLALHHAIAAGRTWSTIHPLLSTYRASLRIPDPITKLTPPLLAAAYHENNEEEELTRLLQLTRNQYSAIVWQGLTEKQQQKAVKRIQEFESLKRLDTVFELLRRYPQSLEGAGPKPKETGEGANKEIVVEPVGTPPKQKREDTGNEAAGPEMIAFHYLSWCYKKGNNKWNVVDKNMEVLQTNIGVAKEHGVLSKKSTDFVNWWGMMKLYFWHCYNALPNKLDIPRADEYLLHVALSIPTTPPDLVELILGLFPQSASRAIPETRTYPLHLACKTTPYTPQYFEILKRRSAIELVLEKFPEAVFVRSDEGQMPLHIAIQAGKTLSEVGPLIRQGPSLLSDPDPVSELYPFQLMAMSKVASHDLRLRFQTIASNMHAEGWNYLTAQQKMKEVKAVEKEYQKRVFTSTFELLRLKASLLSSEGASSGDADVRANLVGMTFSDSPAEVREPNRATIRRNFSGLSQDASTQSCSRSAFSTIDMMSAISNVSSHLSLRRRHRTVHVESDKRLEGDEDEDSDIWSEERGVHDEIEKRRKLRSQSKDDNDKKSRSRNERTTRRTRRQKKSKDKWEPPVDFVATAAEESSDHSRLRNIPTEFVAPIGDDDDISFLDGINPMSTASVTGVRNSSLRQVLTLGDSISGEEEQESSESSDSESDESSVDRTSGSRSAESIQSGDESISQNGVSQSSGISSVEDAAVQNEAPGVTSSVEENAEQQPVEMDKTAMKTDRVSRSRSGRSSIQDDIVDSDGNENGGEVVFNLRRRSCQRPDGAGTTRMAKNGGRKQTGAVSPQNEGGAGDMNFLSILNASLPEGKADYLSTLEVSSGSLPATPNDAPNAGDPGKPKMKQITEC